MAYSKQVDLLEPIDIAEHLDKLELYLGQVCADESHCPLCRRSRVPSAAVVALWPTSALRIDAEALSA